MTAGTRTFRVVEIDPADRAVLDASYEIRRAAVAHDVPDLPPLCRHAHDAMLRVPLPHSVQSAWLIHDGDRPVGVAAVRLPQLDNLDNAECEIFVHPDHRRRGAGRALYEQVVTYVRAAGRRRLIADSVEALPGGAERPGSGTGFARAMGAQDALRDIRRRLDLSSVDTDGYDRLLADAWRRADGYSLVRWRERTPEEHLADVAYLESRLMSDAPMGDLAVEPQKIDAERRRSIDETRIAYGRGSYNTGVRHDATGRIVAWTQLGTEYSVHDHAWQNITLVDPPHRGHRLGTIVKIANLRYALENEPALRFIDTWNAAANDHMISINETLGFRPVDALVNWQQEVRRG
ncbi:GNAT family N-acetyltransferase [Planosporangium thailandense]|uniref:GNAT family N-acetyltransferase n=1 Tax=Planosporangium thailandense TaxID=765197 RepID=A0ABX0Y6G7_9ACTN|nr:GNAT family N-acetyltransferase [Planosporangium thailandense]NJC73623.1 GNAT family N-acetyltransferase [Planosporangium thailandense]